MSDLSDFKRTVHEPLEQRHAAAIRDRDEWETRAREHALARMSVRATMNEVAEELRNIATHHRIGQENELAERLRALASRLVSEEGER